MAIGNRAYSVGGSSAQTEELWKSFRRHVFSLLHMAYRRLPAPSFKTAEEPEITGELACAMREIVESEDAPKWMYALSIHDDPPQNTTPRRGKHRPRLDLEIERSGAGIRPRYGFEAKRLCKPGHPIGKYGGKTGYLGKDGLGMFIDGAYASYSPEVGMLGYVQSGTTEEWRDACRQRLGSTQCVPCKPINDLEIHQSTHMRDTGRPIDIYHLFLIFR
uniref:Uncharacterized protein n=1 Tax=Candidatus Kentrum sp. DK TaxID=2126562 RepID=A0A450T686_9GAMM|nr:MAG: hypothetical protein BECKDK2373B_GA0170837_110811 [Candidatus Kentron sp. DK]